MKIGLSGAQGVGKTTLLNALRKDKDFKNYAFCDEVTRWVKSIGFNINESGNDSTQYMIAMRHIYNLRMHDVFVTDRTMLDCLVYTRYLHENNQVSDECLQEITKIFKVINKDYTKLFYILPEVPVEDDGVRSAAPEFRARIEELFKLALIEDVDVPYIILRGTVKERVNLIKENI